MLGVKEVLEEFEGYFKRRQFCWLNYLGIEEFRNSGIMNYKTFEDLPWLAPV